MEETNHNNLYSCKILSSVKCSEKNEAKKFLEFAREAAIGEARESFSGEGTFFFLIFIFLFIHLFIFGCVGSSLLRTGFL